MFATFPAQNIRIVPSLASFPIQGNARKRIHIGATCVGHRPPAIENTYPLSPATRLSVHMSNTLFSGMHLFCEIVETGSFAAAAKSLGHSASHVSKEIARLEDRLGSRLMNRTTRSFTLTDSGRMFYDHAKQIVEDASTAENRIKSLGTRPFGRLRLCVTTSLAQETIDKWLAQFLALYPEITCTLENHPSGFDFSSAGFDVMLGTAPVLGHSLLSLSLLSTPIVTVGAPEYLGRFGTPMTLQAVGKHDLVLGSDASHPGGLRFTTPDGADQFIHAPPRCSCPSDAHAKTMALAGLGLAQLPEIMITDAMQQGLLVPVLQEFAPPPMTLYVTYGQQNHQPPKLRAFLEFLNEKTTTR